MMMSLFKDSRTYLKRIDYISYLIFTGNNKNKEDMFTEILC